MCVGKSSEITFPALPLTFLSLSSFGANQKSTRLENSRILAGLHIGAPYLTMAHFSFKRTPGVTPKQERSSQQGGIEAGSSPLSSYSRNWPSRSIGGDDRSIPQPSPRYSLNTSGSLSTLPRHFDASRLSSSLSVRRSLSPTREGDGSRLPRIPEDPNSGLMTRRSVVKEELSSPDILAAQRSSHSGSGKPNDGEGGIGFRFSAANPSVSRLSQPASSHHDIRRGPRDLQRSPSRHSSREAVTTSELDLNMVASKFTIDMKNAQSEIEELKHELGVLQGQLEVVKEENSQFSRRLKKVKEVAKESQERSGAILEDLGNSIKSLKEDADSWSEHVREVQSMVPDIKHLRINANETIASLTPYLHGDHLNRNAKELMDELRIDCKNSQEVTTMLRDRLTTLSSDLIEARSRISDLEAILAQDRQAIGSLTVELRASSETTRDLSKEVKTVTKELREALTNADGLEVELADAQQRIEEAEKDLVESKAIREEALVNQEKLSDLNAEIKTLRSSLEQNMSALDERTSSLVKSDQKVSELLKELSTSQTREKVVSEARKVEKATFEEGVKRLESRVSSLEADLERSRESATQANTRLQALQDRFDDQSVTLRLTKETNAELQERVVDVEKTASVRGRSH
ncbi:hypothetical protein BJ322DRAFT_313840 [Thelephora terrestris]|uniref:Uncharacterized protein n=1 Tax=Thelephora terrestris TaxID=56493 RepID=A0A9P6L350_9AGAM|nr:hypothetical protein BJ322DRAFT_313840 [Thelephora terrestris]